MPFSNRHAPEDTAIHRENLEQNIEVRGVGRYFPEEYAGQIQAIRQRGDLIADVPRTLAGIVLNYDDYKLATWANQEQQKINDEATFYKQLEANKRQLLDLDADVEVNDKTVEINSELIKAKENALNNDASVQNAYATVFDKYKGTFDDIPALAQRFNPKFQGIEQASMREALLTDIDTGHKKAASRFVMEFNNLYKPVTQGTMHAVDAMNQLIKNSWQWYQYLDAQTVENTLQSFYNDFVKGEAEYYINLYQTGTNGITAKDTMDMLRSLHESAQQIEGTLVDGKGNPLKDGNGNDRTLSFTLNERTQDYLEQAIRELNSGGKGSGEDEGVMPNIVDDFKERINWGQIEKEGYSDKLLSIGQKGLENWYDEFVNNLLNSNGSDSSKAKKLKETYDMFMTCSTLLKISDLAKESKTDLSTIVRYAADKLNKDITNGNFTKDWEHYDIKFTIDGKDFELGIPALTKTLNAKYGNTGLMPSLGTDQNEAALYWQKTYDILNMAANNISKNEVSEFMNKYNGDYNAASKNINSKLDVSQLFKPDAKGKLQINYAMQAQIENELGIIKKESERAGFKDNVSYNQLDKWINQINNIQDPIQQYQALEVLGNAFVNKSMYNDLVNYAHKRSRTQVENKQSTNIGENSILSVMALKDNSSIKRQVFEQLTNGTYYDNLDTVLKGTNKTSFDTNMENVFNELSIPKEDRKMYKQLAYMCAAVSVEQGSFNTRTFKDNFKNTLNKQYIQVPTQFMKDNGLRNKALNKHATYMKAFYENGADENTLSKITTSAIDTIKEVIYDNEYLKPYLANAEFFPDNETGTIRLRVNGTDISNIGDPNNPYAGVVIYNKDLKNTDPKLIGQALALGAVYAIGATSDSFYKAKQKKSLFLDVKQVDWVQQKRFEEEYGSAKNVQAQYRLRANILNNPKKLSSLLKRASQTISGGAIQRIDYIQNSKIKAPLDIIPNNRKSTANIERQIQYRYKD